MNFIDEPRYVPLDEYHRAIERMTEKVMGLPGVLAVYQIGGLSAPGISDIDMVVVFEDGAECHVDPRQGLSDTDAYLFAHNLFGASLSLFHDSFRHTFFHNFRLLAGDDLRPDIPSDKIAGDIMKRQWANEFLVRMLANMSVERAFGIYKLRNLLLHGKALIYDVEFLGADAPALTGVLARIMDWRRYWFVRRPMNREIATLVTDLWAALVAFLQDHLARHPLHLPHRLHHRIGRSIVLKPSRQVASRSFGVRIPKLPGAMPDRWARSLIAILHRFNRIEVSFPFETDSSPPAVASGFDYAERAFAHNRRHLPHFMPLTSSLVLS